MDPIILFGAGLASVAAIALVLGLRAFAFAPRDAVLERAKRVTRAPASEAGPVAPEEGAAWESLLGSLGGLARPKEANEMGRVRKTLVHAGIRDEHAVETFFGAKMALALALGGGLLVSSALLPAPIPRVRMLVIVLLSVGFYAPNVWLQARVQSRQTALARSLADTLDLIVTCVEAGLGLDAALARIAREIELSAPELASELRQTTMEIHAGVARAAAFRRLAERTGVEELRVLSAIVIQTEMFGTAVGQALRTHAASMRTRRSHRAEEKAATASVKMMLPLIACILPSLFCVILGPAIVRIVTSLSPALRHPS
ncbi:type II secretion system F family protein [Pendulispora albinea]|uniref:Type II secretion system F family protein n=1 Tax=Pendulispora albinea TaxID=2741071 RepID=A0ABZ2LQE7_9BACT